MRRPALVVVALVALVTGAVLLAHLGGDRQPLNPYPSPGNGDPAGTLAFHMLLGRRGTPASVRPGLPDGTGATLLWFAHAPRTPSREESDAALAWVRGGGHLLLLCDGGNASPPPPLLDMLGLKFEPSPFGEPAPVRASPFAGVVLRPSSFELLQGGARIRGLTSDGRPCWVSGTLGRGTWEALADSYAFENQGLDREGNAFFALALVGPKPWVDLSHHQGSPAGRTLGNEPLFWGALLQFALLGGLLLFALRRLGPALEPPGAAGTLRLRAGIARTLAERRSPRELVQLEAESGRWSAAEGEVLRSMARSGDWVGAYRKIRRHLAEKG